MYKSTEGGTTPKNEPVKSFLVNVNISISSSLPFKRIAEASGPVNTLTKFFSILIIHYLVFIVKRISLDQVLTSNRLIMKVFQDSFKCLCLKIIAPIIKYRIVSIIIEIISGKILFISIFIIRVLFNAEMA